MRTFFMGVILGEFFGGRNGGGPYAFRGRGASSTVFFCGWGGGCGQKLGVALSRARRICLRRLM